MEATAQLISAIASVLWPIFAFVSVLVFRKHLISLTKRLRKGKLSGFELELADELDLGERKLEEAKASTPALGSLPESRPLQLPPAADDVATDDGGLIDRDVFTVAESSPTLAVMTVARDIEQELRQILFSQGEIGSRYVFSTGNAVKALRSRGHLSDSAADALRVFQRVRNAVVHGPGEPPRHEVFRALDLGVGVLQHLRSIPRQVVTVRWPSVTLYRDEDATQPVADATGVVLEMKVTNTDDSHVMVFPTRNRFYATGDQVAWEWSSERQWDRTWYKDPVDGAVKHAWDGSMEFVGRVIQKAKASGSLPN